MNIIQRCALSARNPGRTAPIAAVPSLQPLRPAIYAERRSHKCRRGIVPEAKPKNQAAPAPSAEDEDELLDDLEGFEDDGYGEFDDYDEFEDGEFAMAEEDCSPGVYTGSMPWAEAALEVSQQVLQQPELEGLQLYLFRTIQATKRIDIRLDKLSDTYGSPSIDDIERFSRQVYMGLEAKLGVEAAGDISLEVSSPGAERQLRLPEDLQRFGELPLRLEYTDDQGTACSLIGQLQDLDGAGGLSVWAVADVKANAPTKGRGLSKKQRQQRINIAVPNIRAARLYVGV